MPFLTWALRWKTEWEWQIERIIDYVVHDFIALGWIQEGCDKSANRHEARGNSSSWSCCRFSHLLRNGHVSRGIKDNAELRALNKRCFQSLRCSILEIWERLNNDDQITRSSQSDRVVRVYLCARLISVSSTYYRLSKFLV